MRITGRELICQVSDLGPAARNGQIPGMQPATLHPGATSLGQPWSYEPGHGLWLVRQVADHINVVSGPAGSQVTAVFAFVAKAPPETAHDLGPPPSSQPPAAPSS